MAWLIIAFQNQSNAQCPSSTRRIVWEDNFNIGSNLNNNWNFYLGGNTRNLEAAYFRRDNSTIIPETTGSANGVLRIQPLPGVVAGTSDPGIGGAPYRFTSSRLHSKSTVSLSRIRSGRIEARIKTMRDGDRTWPAFWLLHTKDQWPRRGELDIMEQKVRANPATGRGRNLKKNGMVTFFEKPAAYAYGSNCPSNVNGSQFTCFNNVIIDARDHVLPAGVSDDDNTSASYWGGYHVYALEWTPTQMMYYYDNTLVHTVNKSSIDAIGAYWPYNDNDYQIILNVAIGNRTTPFFNDTRIVDGTPGDTLQTNPAYFTGAGRDASMYVDYVRVYQTDDQNYITGNANPYNSEWKEYQLNKQIPATVTWSVSPSTAGTIQSTNTTGLNSAVVQWSSNIPSNAVVTARYTPAGCTQVTLNFPITPRGNKLPGLTTNSLETFTTNPAIPRSTGTNTFGPAGGVVPGQSGNGGNALFHTSSGTTLFDFAALATTQIIDAGQYAKGYKKILMDVYTTAPEGTKMTIQLENGSVATSTNYPTGRHSAYDAFTTVRGRWHTIEFTAVGRPDLATSDFSINNIAIIFDSDPFIATSYEYRIDNIREESIAFVPILSMGTPLLEDFNPLRGRILADAVSSPGYSVIATGGFNNSAYARFVRPAGSAGQYSSIGFTTPGVRIDGKDFRTQRYQFRMKVRTNQLGKRIQLNLENTYLKQGNEFGGTNGVYFATTSSTPNTGWQTLTFVRDNSWFSRSTRESRITKDDEINRISIYPNIGFTDPTTTTYDFDDIEIVAGTQVPDEAIDIALRKPTTATSVRSSPGSFGASNATDGDNGTGWASNFTDGANALTTTPQTLTVNLNGRFDIDSLRINWADAGAFARNYTVQINNNAVPGTTPWTTISTVTNGVSGLYSASFTGTISARWIRIVCTVPNTGAFFGYVINNFRVLGTPLYDDIALTKPAYATSSRTNTTPAAAVDGNSFTSWASDFSVAPNNLTTTQQRLTVNLNGFFNISSFRINWGDAGAYAVGYTVETNDDVAGADNRWVIVDRRTVGTAGIYNRDFGSYIAKARWIRIVCTQPNAGAFFGYVINDFNVFGSPIASGARQSAESQVFEREATPEEAEQNKVYPNPSSDFINVVIPGKAENKSIMMSDMTGRTVMQQDLDNSKDEHTIDISALNEGMYLLLIKNDVKIDVKKIIKQPK